VESVSQQISVSQTDGWIIPQQPAIIFAARRRMHIPVLVAGNANRATVFGPGPKRSANIVTICVGTMENIQISNSKRIRQNRMPASTQLTCNYRATSLPTALIQWPKPWQGTGEDFRQVCPG
jgi:hypothetical protein